MKLSNETIEVLKNFASINMSLLVKPGSKLRTVSPQKTILAQANVKELFTKECAIYDVTQFLNTASMFQDAEFEFGDKSVVIKNGKASANYVYASPSTITTPPEKDIVLPSSDIAFSVEKNAMISALKAAGVMQLPEVALVGKDGTVSLTVTDSKVADGNSFKFPVGQSTVNYTMIFKVENLKLLQRDYDVIISTKGIAHFKSKTGDVEYWIATEAGSKMES
jgi:hypothetical protein